jgi:hypothetical protein
MEFLGIIIFLVALVGIAELYHHLHKQAHKPPYLLVEYEGVIYRYSPHTKTFELCNLTFSPLSKEKEKFLQSNFKHLHKL